jgi:hypothetical protein
MHRGFPIIRPIERLKRKYVYAYFFPLAVVGAIAIRVPDALLTFESAHVLATTVEPSRETPSACTLTRD